MSHKRKPGTLTMPLAKDLRNSARHAVPGFRLEKKTRPNTRAWTEWTEGPIADISSGCSQQCVIEWMGH